VLDVKHSAFYIFKYIYKEEDEVEIVPAKTGKNLLLSSLEAEQIELI